MCNGVSQTRPEQSETFILQVFADAPAHGEPDDRARPGSDLRADGRAHAVAFGCADQQTFVHAYGRPERAAELAALVEAYVRTDVDPDAKTLCQADRAERAPLTVVCLVSPTLPAPPALP